MCIGIGNESGKTDAPSAFYNQPNSLVLSFFVSFPSSSSSWMILLQYLLHEFPNGAEKKIAL
jgi:hypothetical protein